MQYNYLCIQLNNLLQLLNSHQTMSVMLPGANRRFKPRSAKRKATSRLGMLPIDIYVKIYNMVYNETFKDVMNDLKENLTVHYNKKTNKSSVFLKGKKTTYVCRSITPRSSSCQLIVTVWPDYSCPVSNFRRLCQCERQNLPCTDWMVNGAY